MSAIGNDPLDGRQHPYVADIGKEGHALSELVFSDPGGVLHLDAAAIAEEIDRATGAVLGAAWRTARPDDEMAEGEVKIIFLGVDRSRVLHDDTMGSTNRSVPGSRAAWVFVPAIRRLMGLEAADAPQEAKRLAIGIGRVAAHELVHVLAPERGHAATGLMAAQVGRTLLFNDGARFDEQSIAALRSRLFFSPRRVSRRTNGAGRDPEVEDTKKQLGVAEPDHVAIGKGRSPLDLPVAEEGAVRSRRDRGRSLASSR